MKIIKSLSLSLIAVGSLLGTAVADRAPKGPDFVAGAPRARGVDRSLVASAGTSTLDPFDDVAFQLDSAAVLPTAHAQIASVAKWLATHRDQRIVLEGHADSSGVAPYNEDLATRRVVNVRDQLIASGVRADRIVLVVFGEAEAKAASPIDRRVVLYATKVPVRDIANAALDHRKAISVVWTQNGTLYTETRGPRRTSQTTVGTR